MILSLLLCLVFLAALAAAAVKDALSFTIPNWIPALLALAFWPAALAAHLPASVLASDAAVAAVLLLAGMGLFALGWCGGGDAKLLAGASLWLGLPALPALLWWTCVAGALLAIGLLLARRLVPAALPAPAWIGRLAEGQELPYGVAIAAGALMAFPHSVLGAAVLSAVR